MKPILSSLIESIDCDHQALHSRFCVVSIHYPAVEKSQRKEEYKNLVKAIYAAGPVLALIQESAQQRYWVLLPAEGKLKPLDDSLRCKAQPLELVPDWALAKLLIRALPRTLEKPSNERTRFEADGLFYVVRHFKSDIANSNIVVTVKLDLTWSAAAKQQRLAISTTTFTPLALHLNKDGQLPVRIAQKPRYQLDSLGQSLSRHARGDYIQQSFWRNKKERVEAFALAGVVSLESYYTTRLGSLSLFQQDLQEAYGDALKINLQHIQPEHRVQINAGQVNQSYHAIWQQLSQLPILICNHSSEPQVSHTLLCRLQDYGMQASTARSISPQALNLLLVDDRDSYKEGQNDPYKLARQEYPQAVIQSCHPASLAENSKHVVEVLLKELLIKFEIQQCRLLIDYPELPADAWFITSIRPGGKLLRNDPWPMYRVAVQAQQLQFAKLNEQDESHIRDCLSPAQTAAVFEGYQRSDLIYWPASGDALIMQDTDALSLPDEPSIHGLIKQMDHCINSGIPTQLIQNYCNQNPDSGLLKFLQSVLEEHPGEVAIPVTAFKSQAYRGTEAIHFYDHLAEQGYRFKASLQAQPSGALTPTTGLWFNSQLSLYSAGSVGSAQRKQDNFNHIYKVEGNGIAVPGWFWPALQVWHIRHRGTTVYPFIFKHIKEYAQRQLQSSTAESA